MRVRVKVGMGGWVGLRVRVCARARVCGGVGVGAALLAGLAHGRDGPVEVEPGGDAAHCHTIPLCG